MLVPSIAFFLLLAQNPVPQPPVAPASIEGVAVKAGSGEPLSKVTVTLINILSPANPAARPAESASTIFGVGASDPVALELMLARDVAAFMATGGNTARTSRQSVTSGADGKFSFENLKPGSYQLKASINGYAPAEYGQRSPNGTGITFTLKAGQKMQNVSLPLTPAGSIAGRVVDANGDPVIRAVVQAQKIAYQKNGRALVTVQAVITDDRGDYRLFWLPAGPYYVSASPSDGRTTARSDDGAVSVPLSGVVPGVTVISSAQSNGEIIEEATVPVFYPAALSPANATPIDVRPGMVSSGVNITTLNSRVYRIRGRVIDAATGRPIPTASIDLIPTSGSMVSPAITIRTDSNSPGFEISGVVPGSYYIRAGSPGIGRALSQAEGLREIAIYSQAASAPVIGTAAVEVRAADVNDLAISLSGFVILTGHFAVEGATKTPAVQIYLEAQSGELPSTNSTSQSGADGSFALVTVPGDYRVGVNAPSGIVPKSILYNGRDAQADGIHIGNAGGSSLEVVLTSKGGRLDGNVLVDRQQRVPNATVVLMPVAALRRQTDLYKTVQSAADGHFVIENISPGTFRVFAWDDIPANAWFDAEYMRDFESLGRDITIREDSTENLDITVIPR